MHAHRLIACLGVLAVGFGVLARDAWAEQEQNTWPVVVRRTESAGNTSSWSAAGPLIFRQPAADGGSVAGVRPFWVQTRDAAGQFRAGYFLYPLFSYRTDENSHQWNVFQLIRWTDFRADPAAKESVFRSRSDFEVWPFWFSRQTGDPELSYRGLFPVGGTIKNKLGFDRATWVIFPLYAQTEKRGTTTTSVPWPFVRVTRGAAHGFGLWPLFEWRERTGSWRQETYLWPLGYNHTRYPAADAPAGTPPTRDIGALPFYARRTAPGYRDENFLWPFFGYTDRTQPKRYHETRYFWPLLVQGRGDDRYVNRWGPFYTHSVVKGYDKTWYAWPVFRHAEWSDRGLALSKTQVLYFLYWSEHQRSATRPETPNAQLTHLWPLFSRWDNGAGRKQWQVFSPLEVFFPGNEKVRAAWTPLFAVVRHDTRAPGDSRTSLLWNAVTWEQRAAENAREFHLGPLFSVAKTGESRRVAIGNGLLGWQRAESGGWRFFWLDFASKPTPTSTSR